jgi:hypothetical protein
MSILAFISMLVAQSFFGSLPIDGIQCNQMEGAVEHIHSRLLLYDRGKAVAIPAQIGISQTAGCLYWVHTHTADGFIHMESPVKRTFTLGQFFDIWAQPLGWTQAGPIKAASGKKLSIWVNGKSWSGKDPRSIQLQDQETIVIQNGPPFAKPAATDWSTL